MRLRFSRRPWRKSRGIVAGRDEIDIFTGLHAVTAQQRYRGQVGWLPKVLMPMVLPRRSVSFWTLDFDQEQIAELVLGGHHHLIGSPLIAPDCPAGADRVVEVVREQRVGGDRTGDQHMLGCKPCLA